MATLFTPLQAGDLTYVWTAEGWLYLAVMLDLYSRTVIGWAMGTRLTGDLAERALTMALTNRIPATGLLHHSDRGSQYAATRYQRLLGEHGIITSMSRTGNCWDNACVESFFGTLKRELVYHRHHATRGAAKQDIIGSAVTRPLAMTSRPSTKRGWQWLNQGSTELGEGQNPPYRPLPRHSTQIGERGKGEIPASRCRRRSRQ
ncbi:MAG: IS3 family transposase [Nitrospiraceae bacterium]|nr:IS3 family transposase [Nitrospiraceae bacterium]